MTLSDREKFIAHYLSTTLVGMLDKQPEEAVEAVIEGLRTTRLRHLKDSEIEEIVKEHNDEFLVSGALMTGLSKMREEENKEWDR